VPRIGSCTERMRAGSIDPRKAIMRFRWIIVVGAVDLVIAWWRENLTATYVAAISCMILYGLRVIGLQLERIKPSEFDIE
jgi:hypothetical protein